MPEIRFKNFKNEWKHFSFKEIAYKAGIKNSENLSLESYSISIELGFIPQKEQFENGGTMSKADKRMYFIVSSNSFAYNPARINVGSLGYYQGVKDVIVSSLYEVFKTSDIIDDLFLLYWFKTNIFKRMIEQYQEGGVRLYFFFDKLQKCQIKIPSLQEQQKIASYFQKLDSLIQTTSKKLASLKQIKAASLQSMFPQEGETVPKVRFKGFEGEWEKIPFGSFLKESYERSTVENEDILLSSAITGVYLNSELFGHQRGASNIGYKKIKKNMLILSAQNLHLGNANVNLRFEHGLISPAYKVYEIVNISPLFLQQWIKMDSTKVFFLNATTAGASLCRKNIVWDDLYKQIVLIPSKNEQVKIGLFFSNLDKQISLQTQHLEKLKQIKAACLDKMFV